VTSDFIKPGVVAGVKLGDPIAESRLMMDWEILTFLNGLPVRKDFMRQPSQPSEDLNYYRKSIDQALSAITSRLNSLDLGFRAPEAEVIAALFPSQ
jgi:hypothetical protein